MEDWDPFQYHGCCDYVRLLRARVSPGGNSFSFSFSFLKLNCRTAHAVASSCLWRTPTVETADTWIMCRSRAQQLLTMWTYTLDKILETARHSCLQHVHIPTRREASNDVLLIRNYIYLGLFTRNAKQSVNGIRDVWMFILPTWLEIFRMNMVWWMIWCRCVSVISMVFFQYLMERKMLTFKITNEYCSLVLRWWYNNFVLVIVIKSMAWFKTAALTPMR